MITCNLMGGLGNQLFQLFTTISYAIKVKDKFVFLNLKSLGTGATKVRNTYWENFLNNLSIFLVSNIENFVIIKEKEFMYNDILSEIYNSKINSNNNICIYGYFQSYKYFQNNSELICRILDIKKQKENIIKEYNNHNLENTVSIHFRLDDYKKLPNIYPIMNYEYYYKSLTFIQSQKINNLNILFFCEDGDLDDVNIIIEKLKLDFQKNTFTRAPNTFKDWEQMLLMSCCKYNIIANSTFSWWGAYLNSDSDKIVCCPRVWFVNNTDTNDLCPIEWVKI